MEGRIRQPPVPLAVKPHAVKLELQIVVPVSRGVKHYACPLVHLEDVPDFKRCVARERRDQLSTEIIEIQVRPAVTD